MQTIDYSALRERNEQVNRDALAFVVKSGGEATLGELRSFVSAYARERGWDTNTVWVRLTDDLRSGHVYALHFKFGSGTVSLRP